MRCNAHRSDTKYSVHRNTLNFTSGYYWNLPGAQSTSQIFSDFSLCKVYDQVFSVIRGNKTSPLRFTYQFCEVPMFPNFISMFPISPFNAGLISNLTKVFCPLLFMNRGCHLRWAGPEKFTNLERSRSFEWASPHSLERHISC